MKVPARTLVAAFSIVALACGAGKSDSTESQAYGFPAPGLEPELFAFDLLRNDAAQLALAMSPQHDEMYYSQLIRNEEGISFELLRSEFVAGEWTAPEPAQFVSEHGEIEAFFSVSGSRLYFFSRRPVAGAIGSPSPWNLWYVEKTREAWSEPRLLGQPDSLVVFNWSANLLNDSTLFITARPYEDPGLAELYEVSIAGNIFGELRNLGGGVNTRDHTENEPAIAPDGSYLIFYSAGRPDNLSSELLGDLYISFRGDDGSWLEAIRIDEPINSTSEENWPRISADGRFLFFSSDRREGFEMPDLYWVSTRALDRYRPNQ
jgi:hypothetical protein